MDDAEFIVSIRSGPRGSRFLTEGASSVEAQRQWIANYLNRYRQGQEYYFISCDQSGRPWGASRIYDIGETECTAGSWVMKSGAPIAVSLESYLLTMKFAFEDLYKSLVHVDVRKENVRVWRWHELCGATFVQEDEASRHYTYSLSEYHSAKRRVRLILPED